MQRRKQLLKFHNKHQREHRRQRQKRKAIAEECYDLSQLFDQTW